MRYPPGYKEKKRRELLKTIGHLIKKNGFAATGIDTLMQRTGMTSGAFYSHFASKNELLQALVASELTASSALWAGRTQDSVEEWIDSELERYLSLQHVQHPEEGCLLPALAAEIARADASVRTIYEQALLQGHCILSRRLGDDDLAWAVINQMVGSILVARALPSETLQRTLLNASKNVLKSLLQRRKSPEGRAAQWVEPSTGAFADNAAEIPPRPCPSAGG